MRNPLEEVASWAEPTPAPRLDPTSRNGSFNLENFIALHLQVRRGPLSWDGKGTKWELEVCPFNAEHTGGCAVVTQNHDGAIGFKCQHNGCIDHHWRDVRALFDGPRRAPGILNGNASHSAPQEAPKIMSVQELYATDFPPSEMLVEGLAARRGGSLIVGAPKSGKTLVAVQMAVAVASGKPFLGYYRVIERGAAMILEQDDPAGASSIKTILLRSNTPAELPLYVVPRVPFGFGPELLSWMEQQIVDRHLALIVLDSYTALRGSRGPGVDIVKAEQFELTQLDELGKSKGCAIEIIHHGSKGSAGLDWTSQAAGTFVMAAATEGQIFVSRFPEFDGTAPERLVRVRGRHTADLEMVIRFREATLDYERVLEGSAAPLYPLLLKIKNEFSHQTFTPKQLTQATGVSIATSHRQIDRLYKANALLKLGFGDYRLSEAGQ